MNQTTTTPSCDRSEQLPDYALGTLAPEDRALVEAHLPTCARCREELQSLRTVVDSFAAWPTDLLRPSASLRDRLAQRIAADAGREPIVPPPRLREPRWERVAPGISCKLLATDRERDRVSMLVRLEPGAEYPPHEHAGTEELHLLAGELWIDDRKLYPGDYNRAERGTSDARVWSETGCTCVLVTSPSDILR